MFAFLVSLIGIVGLAFTVGLLRVTCFFVFSGDKRNPDYPVLKRQLDFLDEELAAAEEPARIRQLSDLRAALAPKVAESAPVAGPTPDERAFYISLTAGLVLAIVATTAKVVVLLHDWYMRLHPDRFDNPYADHSRFQYITLWLIIAGCVVAVMPLVVFGGIDLWTSRHNRPDTAPAK